MDYDNVTLDNLNRAVDELEIPIGYETNIQIRPYNENDSSLEDLVKTVEITISYQIGKEMEMVKLSRIKSRESLIIPNKPILGNTYVPVIYKEDNIKGNYWKIVSYNDPTWYNYSNKNWATVMLIQGLEIEGGTEINSSNREELTGMKITKPTDIFVWIPRYGIQNGQVEFLYKTTKRTVDDSGKLSEEDLITSFEDSSTGEYILATNISNLLYKTLNESKYGPRK